MATGTYQDGGLTLSLEVTGAPTVTTGSGAPGSTPAAEGDIYVDTTNDVSYIAAGTASSADWKLAGASGLNAVVDDTTPQLGGMLDVNGQAIGDGTLELLTFTETGSAVNHLNITNAATTNAPILGAAGDDTNIGITLTPKGSGNITLGTMVFDADQSIGAGQDNYVLTYDNGTGTISLEAASGGGASQLSDLSDVNTSTATNRNVLVADGVDWESRALVEADISDLGTYLTDVVSDTTPQLGGALDGQGNDLNNMGVLFMTEQAAAEVDVAGKGQLWVKTATPNQLWFTDDAGTDFQLASLAGTETLTNKTINTASNTITIVEADISDLGSYITASSADTLTNKTIDGDNNTISNLDLGNEVDWAVITDVADRTAFASGDKILIFEAGVGMRKIDYDDLPGAGGGLSNVVEDTTPQLGGQLDVNGQAIGDGTNELLTFTEAASAVNHISIGNAATGGYPYIVAAGDDTNIDLGIDSKGSGSIVMYADVSFTGNITATSGSMNANVVQQAGVQVATISNSVTLTNKTIDSDNNTITNIANADIKTGAAIDAAKIHDGTVSNTEYGYLNGVTSAIQTQLDAKGTLSNVSEDTTPQLGGDLDLNDKAFTVELTAAETVAKGDLGVINGSGQVDIADASTLAEVDGMLVMAQEAITATNVGTFYTFGHVTGLSGLTAGTEYYVSTTGTTGNTLTATKPSASNEGVRKVGTALSTTELFFFPSQDVVVI